jgi:hypothetical protein
MLVLLRLPVAWPLSAGKEQTCAILAERCGDGEQCVGRARCWGKDDAAQTRVFPDGTQPHRRACPSPPYQLQELLQAASGMRHAREPPFERE